MTCDHMLAISRKAPTAVASTRKLRTLRSTSSYTAVRSNVDRNEFSIMTDADSKKLIADSIRGIPNFPKPGILFWDVTTLMLDAKAFQASIDAFVARYKDQKIDVVAGFEARGLIFGAPIALALGCAFVPLRKPGKLPGETISEEYTLEYGSDKIEMHLGHVTEGQRVLLIDDLIATGGTMGAGIKLMDKVKAEVVECACVIELPDLKGREKLQGKPLYVLIEKEGLWM